MVSIIFQLLQIAFNNTIEIYYYNVILILAIYLIWSLLCYAMYCRSSYNVDIPFYHILYKSIKLSSYPFIVIMFYVFYIIFILLSIYNILEAIYNYIILI